MATKFCYFENSNHSASYISIQLRSSGICYRSYGMILMYMPYGRYKTQAGKENRIYFKNLLPLKTYITNIPLTVEISVLQEFRSLCTGRFVIPASIPQLAGNTKLQVYIVDIRQAVIFSMSPIYHESKTYNWDFIAD